jgi:hypothetical protein
MTDWTMQSTSGDPQILSRRLGAYLNRTTSAKQLALLIGCDQRTAENLRAGRTWPIARHWLGLWVEFGNDVLEAVFYPERVEARLQKEAAERDQARRQRLASATGLAEVRTFGLAARLVEGDGADEEPAELGPPNLDLFEAGTFTQPQSYRAGAPEGA